MKKSFTEKVYDVVAAIPKGKVMSYGAVAKSAGSRWAARAVGNIMNKNPDTQRVPCHRVVCSDGSVGGYAYGAAKKVTLLKKEGVKIEKGKVSRECLLG